MENQDKPLIPVTKTTLETGEEQFTFSCPARAITVQQIEAAIAFILLNDPEPMFRDFYCLMLDYMAKGTEEVKQRNLVSAVELVGLIARLWPDEHRKIIAPVQ